MTKDDVMDEGPRAVDGFWMRPQGDTLVVEQRKARRRRSTVIEEVEGRERPFEGKVLALSEKAAASGLQLGDVVLFTRYAGQEGVVPLGSDQVFVVLHLDEVLVVLDDAKLEAAEKAIKDHDEAAKRAAEESLNRMRKEALEALDNGGRG